MMNSNVHSRLRYALAASLVISLPVLATATTALTTTSETLVEKTVEQVTEQSTSERVSGAATAKAQVVPASLERALKSEQQLTAVPVADTAPVVETRIAPKHSDAQANALKAKLAAITDMSARFKQQVIDDKGQVVQSSEGQMWVKKPQQFRWEVAEPYAQIIVADQTQVWLYDKDLEQAVVRTLDQQISNVPALLISGDVSDLSKHYAVSKAQDSGGKETFILKPTQAQGDALFIELQASFVDNQLAVMRLVDNLGQFTHIAFSDIENNKAIDDAVFQLDLPEYVDIIREDKPTIEDVDMTTSNAG